MKNEQLQLIIRATLKQRPNITLINYHWAATQITMQGQAQILKGSLADNIRGQDDVWKQA